MVQEKRSIARNPKVQAATVALLALSVAHPEVDDEDEEYHDKVGKIIGECCSRMGLEGKLTRRQQAKEDAVGQAILVGADKMKAALVAARLLSKRN
jgi:hypothetical protein